MSLAPPENLDAGGGTVIAVCLGARAGEPKKEVSVVKILGGGIEGDCHRGDWHRQVSLLEERKINELREEGLDLSHGAFGENIVVRDFDLDVLLIGQKILLGNNIVLEVTQKGKQCHAPCKIFYQAGRCIMPAYGVFARVIRGGTLGSGEPIALLPAEAEVLFQEGRHESSPNHW